MSWPRRLSLDWSELRLPGGGTDLRRLEEAAAAIAPRGVPRDLLCLVEDRGPLPLDELLRLSYDPNVLACAYVHKGRELGLLAEGPGGILAPEGRRRERLAARFDARVVDAFFADLRQHVDPARYQDPRPHLTADALAAVAGRGDLWRGMRALSIGDGEGIALCLRQAGVEDVWVVDVDPSVAAYYAAHGVRALVADTRFARDFVFGAFDVVRSYQIEGEHDECVLAMVYANLVDYGAYYTYFVGHENERHELWDFVARLERSFVVTDLREHQGSFVVRAVKNPELEAFYHARRPRRATLLERLTGLASVPGAGAPGAGELP